MSVKRITSIHLTVIFQWVVGACNFLNIYLNYYLHILLKNTTVEGEIILSLSVQTKEGK